jgi:phosphatidylinositol alpha-mannosyltransferase
VTLLEDPELRSSLQASASVAVRLYDWSAVATRILRVYETVVQGRVR